MACLESVHLSATMLKKLSIQYKTVYFELLSRLYVKYLTENLFDLGCVSKYHDWKLAGIGTGMSHIMMNQGIMHSTRRVRFDLKAFRDLLCF